MEANARLLFPESIKEHNFDKKFQVMALNQSVALVMLNKEQVHKVLLDLLQFFKVSASVEVRVLSQQ